MRARSELSGSRRAAPRPRLAQRPAGPHSSREQLPLGGRRSFGGVERPAPGVCRPWGDGGFPRPLCLVLGHPCYEPSPPSGPETREERSAWPRARLPVEMYLNLGDAGRLREAVGEAPNGRSSNWRDLVPTGQRRKTAGAKGLDYHGPGVGGVHGGSCGGSGVQLRQEGGQGCCEALFVGELATRGIQLGSSSRVTHT